MEASFTIIDTTLRDGEQAPGVVFSPVERRRILRELVRTGIREIEVRVPPSLPEGRRELRRMKRQAGETRLTGWCRGVRDDLEACAACELEAVHIALPVSDIQLEALQRSRAWVLEQLLTMGSLAVRWFPYVSVGIMDASRADPGFLDEIVAEAEGLAVHRVRLADTVGRWTPWHVEQTFRRLRGRMRAAALAFHGHNDLGLATANALAAVLGGARFVDVTVNGLGERAGNTSLAEFVMAAEVGLDLPAGIDTRRLTFLAGVVARAAGRPAPAYQPVVGSAVHRHESGIHVHGQLRHRLAFQPFLPERIGQARERLDLGWHSGRTAVRRQLAELGLHAGEGSIQHILQCVRHMSARRKRGVSARELEEIALRHGAARWQTPPPPVAATTQ